jgi:acetyl-CoA synthetase
MIFVDDLPKTRNMKIMRRVIRALICRQSTGDLSSLSNPDAVTAMQRVLDARPTASA